MLTGARRVGLALAAVLVLAGLTACTGDPDPKAAAATLATALASGSTAHVPWADGAPAATAITERRAAVLHGLGSVTPTVQVASVSATKDTATATLAWRWPLAGGAVPWTYRTTATLALVQGTWRTTWSSALLAPALTDAETLAVTRTQATRGRVLGADDQVIVTPRPVARVGIDKTLVDAAGQDAAARALATALGLDPDAYAAKVDAAGPKAFVQAIVVRTDDPAYDLVALGALTGVREVNDRLPLPPTRTFARQLLGTVGDATAEIVEATGGAVVAGDQTGLSGLQRAHDAQLRGTPGVEVDAVSENGTVKRRLLHVDPVAGTDLQLTLDVSLQEAAERVLATVGPASAIVAIRPSTGDLLAVASGAGGNGQSTATLGTYAPGSTFKIVSALALLRAGLTPQSTVACPPSVTVAGRQFDNVPDYPSAHLGSIPLTTAVAHSCNTAFVGSADKVTDADLAGAAASLGLTGSAGFSSVLATVPTSGSATDHAAAMIGQGAVLASPLGMATATASVVAGRTVSPRLVLDAAATGTASPGTASAGVTGTTSASAAPVSPLTATEAASLRTMLRAVVTDGTATGALRGVGPADLIAKTGTAQYQTSTGALANHAWLVAGTVSGDLAVAVFVETGDFGATTGGPLMAAFLHAALG